jgi:CRP-like cAMP-binding protein
METIIKILQKFSNIPQESLERFVGKLQEKNIPKGETLIREGEICNRLSFIKRGFVRSYYFKDKKDITISFSIQGEFIASMASFISQKPSYETIEALEPCELFQISHQDLMDLFEKDSHLEHLYRLILEQYYVALEEHLIFSKFKTAKERYLELIENKPHIIQKAAVGQIASYLDMSLETLSRIRASI